LCALLTQVNGIIFIEYRKGSLLPTFIIMTVKEHYDNHLGNFYSWMAGDFNTKQNEQQRFFIEQKILPFDTSIAIDLGAGHGLQSVSLAKLGFTVKAIDFNQQLLSELSANSQGLPIEIIYDDIRTVKNYSFPKPELIVCTGDTITHLSDKKEIKQLIKDCVDVLCDNGKFIISFRDFSNPLIGDSRFIPVKSDDSRILTCCLDYLDNQVLVTDLLYTKIKNEWHQSISSYYKIRIGVTEIVDLIQDVGLKVLYNEPVNRLIMIVAQK